MLSNLMRAGGHCVNYLNLHSRGLSAAFGFYVCDEMQEGAAYSRPAKRRLYQGLCVIQAKFGWENLIGVYVDVSRPGNLSRCAYQQMKEDLRAGFFRRVFVVCLRDLLGDPTICQELEKLSLEVGGFELIQIQENYLSVGSLLAAPPTVLWNKKKV